MSAQTVHSTSFWSRVVFRSASTSMASLRGDWAAAAGAASVTAAGAFSLGGASISIAIVLKSRAVRLRASRGEAVSL